MLDFAFQRIGGKYKGHVLWALSKHTVMRYGELRREMSDISTKMLTQTLRELETEIQFIVKCIPKSLPKSNILYQKQAKNLFLS